MVVVVVVVGGFLCLSRLFLCFSALPLSHALMSKLT